MKISKSKQELARIISENGGWRCGAKSAAQCRDCEISFWSNTAKKRVGEDWCGNYLGASNDIKSPGFRLPNWHQTILSREEYFHLYPAHDADGWIEWDGGNIPVGFGTLVDVKLRGGNVELGQQFTFSDSWGHHGGVLDIIAYRLHKPEQANPEFCESVMRSIQEPEAKPTIEQLAADYRNTKDYADRKQEEADAAKADADARLKALELAGEALGLIVSPITAKQDSELVSEVKVGDEVECVEPNVFREKYRGMIGTILEVDVDDESTPYLVNLGGRKWIWCHKVKFIRRP